MSGVKIRKEEDILTLEHTVLEEENIYSIFLKNPNATLYVTDCGKIIGIITLGNFRRNRQKQLPLVNNDFTFVGVGEDAKALAILEERTNIKSIPVLDNEHRLVKEYYKEYLADDKIDFDFVYRLATEFSILKYGYDKIVLIVSELSTAEKQLAEELFQKSEESIYLTDYLGREEIKELAKEKSFVYDFCKETYWVRETYYKIWKIESLRVEGNFYHYNWKEVLHDRANLYQRIAVLSEEIDFWKNILDERIELVELIGSQCAWNVRKKCYEYVKGVTGNVEAFFLIGHFKDSDNVLINGKEVCCINMLVGDSVDLDIVNNILPQFEKHHIKYLIIDNPEGQFEQIADNISVDLKKSTDIPSCEFYGVSEEDYCEFHKELDSVFPPVMKNGYVQISDRKGKYANYLNNERLTMGNPPQIEHTIYLFGPCLVRGHYVSDKDTIASCLRKKVNEKYYIRNYGGGFGDMNYCIRNHEYQSGDIVLIFTVDAFYYKKYGIKVHSIIEAYKREDNLIEHVWDRLLHCNHVITKNIADVIYDIFVEQCFLNGKENVCYEKLYFGQSDAEIILTDSLKGWMKEILIYKRDTGGGYNGSIVMNCNPFTIGHRYLIEEAAKEVDVLYIFVVEEDKSFFKFEDRFKMVKIGTCDLENVVVIPSGKYIISAATLPGYFEKDNNQDVKLDATQDLELFARKIAKEFDISIRFAGEEPIDLFTQQYNQEMLRILPQYGIAFKEIPRKKMGGEVISASRVRNCIKDGNYEIVKRLVLPQIYQYLQKNYF